ncbi:MAG: hypothetical protein AABX89_06215 [Candidatus Thermoplasmatota archaeon]
MKPGTLVSLTLVGLLLVAGFGAAQQSSSSPPPSSQSSEAPETSDAGNGTADNSTSGEPKNPDKKPANRGNDSAAKPERCRADGAKNATDCPDPSSVRPNASSSPERPCDVKRNPHACRERYCAENPRVPACRKADARAARDEAREAFKEALGAALDKRRLGAEVAVASTEGTTTSSILTYDDVAVEVGTGQATVADPLTITLSSELAEGRAFSFHLNGSLVPGGEEGLRVQYFDVVDAGQTEVILRKATDLADVLNPADDGGQPEYWIVEDADGLQLLVSVPHWSTHVLSITGLPVPLTPTLLLGVVAGIAASILAGVALFVPRRRDD